MDKYLVEANMKNAYTAIENVFKIKSGSNDRKEVKVDKSIRSKMSAFGATVMMSGLEPAKAYYTKNEEKIIKLLDEMCINNNVSFDEAHTDEILAYSVSLKLALNMYI